MAARLPRQPRRVPGPDAREPATRPGRHRPCRGTRRSGTAVKSLAYRVDGPPDGPVVVLGSSLGTTGSVWEPQLAALAATHRVVRYDHRGHGDSPAPPGPYAIEELGGDVLALLDRLEGDRADL